MSSLLRGFSFLYYNIPTMFQWANQLQAQRVLFYPLAATVTQQEHLSSAHPALLRPKRNVLAYFTMSMCQAGAGLTPTSSLELMPFCHLFSCHVSGSLSVYTDICFCSVPFCFFFFSSFSQLPLLLRWHCPGLSLSTKDPPTPPRTHTHSVLFPVLFVDSQNCL